MLFRSVQDKIVIRIGLRDRNAFSTIENALVNYFNTNEYLISLNISRLNSLKEKESMFLKNMAEIDSLQRIEYFEKKNENSIKLDQKLIIKTDKQMFYYNKIDILKQKEDISRNLISKIDITSVISKSQPTAKPLNSLGKTLIKNLIIIYILFLLISLILEYRKPIFDYLRERE